MTAVHDDDSFFDSDGERDNQQKLDSPYLKGAYDRGGDSPAAQRVAKNKSLTPSTSGNFSAKSSDSIMSEQRGTESYGYARNSTSRSRTPSPYRSPAARSPTYSDSFNSEDSEQDSRRASPERTKKETSAKPRRRAGGGYNSTSSSRFNSGTSQDSRTTYKSSSYGKPNNRPKKAFQKAPARKPAAASHANNKRSNSIASSQASPRNAGNEVTRRMLSAKGHTISRLRNEFNQLQQAHDETLRENKLLKALQRRQERALAKFDDEESELPQLLRKHSAELDSMRRRIRKYQEHERDKDRRMKDKDEQLLRKEDELKRLRAVAEDKGLLERDELQRRADRLRTKLEARDKKVDELERYAQHMKKNRRHENHERQGREEELKGSVVSLERENERLQMQLREKEKELEVRNIYSNRLIKPPGKLRPSVSPTGLRPVMLSKATSTADQPRQPRPAPPQDRPARGQSAEELRRREETNARVRSPKAAAPRKEDEPKREEPKQEEPNREEPQPREPTGELSEHERILRDLDIGWEKRDDGRDARPRQEEERRRLEEAERRRQHEEERQQDLEEKLRREEERRRRRQPEEEEKEAVAKKKRDEEEKDRERKKKEVHQDTSYSPDFDNSPGHDEEENVPFFGSQPADEQKKPPTTRTPPYAVNSVRDLHKYSRGDNNGSPKRGKDEGAMPGQNQANNADQEKESERLAEERRKKDLLLARMRDIDDGKKPDSGKSHRSYNFSQPVENLHNGVPSHPDETGPARAKKDDALSFGGYAPTFTSGKAAQKPKKKSFFDDDDGGDPFSKPTPAASQPEKKSNLMEDLFGNSPSEEKSTKSSFGDDKNVFTSSTKAKPVSYPWEKKVETGGVANGVKDKGPPNSKTALNMSHDSLDDIDDIEEVVL